VTAHGSSKVRIGSGIALVAFAVFTAFCLAKAGLNGFVDAIAHSLTSAQVFADLVIALLFWAGWVLRDARSRGRSGWGWIVFACCSGSIAPLAYAAVHGRWPGSPGNAASGNARSSLGAVGLAALGGLTIAALVVDGLNVPANLARNWCSAQIWVDLVIAIVFWLGWALRDARSRGVSPWGWLAYAAALGSFAPLTYLAVHGRSPGSHPPARLGG